MAERNYSPSISRSSRARAPKRGVERSLEIDCRGGGGRVLFRVLKFKQLEERAERVTNRLICRRNGHSAAESARRAADCRQTGALQVESREQRAANGESWGGERSDRRHSRNREIGTSSER